MRSESDKSIEELELSKNKVALDQLKAKCEDRNTTISALVKSLVILEKRMLSVQKENESLRQKLSKASIAHRKDQERENNDASFVAELERKDADIKAHKKEVESVKKRESELIMELAQSREKACLKEIEAIRRLSQLQEFTDQKEMTGNFQDYELSLSEEIGELRKQLVSFEGDSASKLKCGLLFQLQNIQENDSLKKIKAQLMDQRKRFSDHEKELKSSVSQNSIHEKHISSLKEEILHLKTQIDSYKSEIELIKSNTSSKDMHEEIQRIQEESEIFAGQVIEQDEEILRLNAVCSEN